MPRGMALLSAQCLVAGLRSKLDEPLGRLAIARVEPKGRFEFGSRLAILPSSCECRGEQEVIIDAIRLEPDRLGEVGEALGGTSRLLQPAPS